MELSFGILLVALLVLVAIRADKINYGAKNFLMLIVLIALCILSFSLGLKDKEIVDKEVNPAYSDITMQELMSMREDSKELYKKILLTDINSHSKLKESFDSLNKEIQDRGNRAPYRSLEYKLAIIEVILAFIILIKFIKKIYSTP